MRSRSARSRVASPSKRKIALMPHIVREISQYRKSEARPHPQPADRTGNPDRDHWIALECYAHQSLRWAGHQSSMECDTWRSDCSPLAPRRERFHLAHDGGPVDRRIAQPVPVPLGEQKMLCRTAPSFVNDPMDHDAAARKEGDDLSCAPKVIRPAADANSCTVRDSGTHAAAAQAGMYDRLCLRSQRSQARQIVDCSRPGGTRYEVICRLCRDRSLAH